MDWNIPHGTGTYCSLIGVFPWQEIYERVTCHFIEGNQCVGDHSALFRIWYIGQKYARMARTFMGTGLDSEAEVCGPIMAGSSGDRNKIPRRT